MVEELIMKIFCDNLLVVFYSKNNKRLNGSKHTQIKYLIVTYKVKDGLILVELIGFEIMIITH